MLLQWKDKKDAKIITSVENELFYITNKIVSSYRYGEYAKRERN